MVGLSGSRSNPHGILALLRRRDKARQTVARAALDGTGRGANSASGLGYSRRTEDAYCGWIRRFILSNDRRHPREMGSREVERFLTGIAVDAKVAASTQNQALAARLFLYREVLGIDLPWMESIRRARRPERLPVVLSQDEVKRVLAEMEAPAGWARACCTALV